MDTGSDAQRVWPRVAALAGTAGLAISISFSLAGCGRGNNAPGTVAAAPAASPVETQLASIGATVRYTPVTGSLLALKQVSLSSRIPGRLAEVAVREGDTVAAGQIVARLDTSDQESQVQTAEGAVAAAQARVAQAEAAYGQARVSTRSAVRSAEAAYGQQRVSTQAGIESARAGLEAAQAQLSQVREGSRGQDVRRAQSQVAVAKANLTNAQADLKRYRQLAKEGAVAQAVLDKYETAADVASEQMAAAQESLSLVKEGARSQEVTQAEQNVRQAEERLRQARAAAAMDKVRQADVETARAGLAQNEVRRAEVLAARAALTQARGSLNIARKALSDSAIRTTISGQVASRRAEPGQVVGAGVPLIDVVALDSVYFEPSVPDTDFESIAVGQPVEVSVKALPGRTFTGRVAKLFPSGSSLSRSFPIRITLSNPEHVLRPQMFAQGRVEVTRHNNVVVVPRGAILRDGDTSANGRVFVEVGGIARQRAVTVGLPTADGESLEVRGIPSGARVIVSGHTNLDNGATVTPAPGDSRLAATR